MQDHEDGGRIVRGECGEQFAQRSDRACRRADDGDIAVQDVGDETSRGPTAL
jgi:hypothetical protein